MVRRANRVSRQRGFGPAAGDAGTAARSSRPSGLIDGLAQAGDEASSDSSLFPYAPGCRVGNKGGLGARLFDELPSMRRSRAPCALHLFRNTCSDKFAPVTMRRFELEEPTLRLEGMIPISLGEPSAPGS